MTFKSIIIAIPMAVLAFAGAPAVATDFATASVSYGGLDLASPAGIKELDQRLNRATRAVCGDRWSRDLGGHREYTRCVRETAARVSLQRQRVISAYLVKNGEQLAAR